MEEHAPDDEWVEPDLSGVVTEDDGAVGNIFSEKQQRLLIGPLYDSWQGPLDEDGGPRPFVAMSNVGLFFRPEDQPLVPDVLLSADVVLPLELWAKKHRSYFVWQYGKPPDVVVEVVSNREGRELSEKLRIYERIRVAHYDVFEPIGQLGDARVRCFELGGDRYVDRIDARFERLGLSLIEWQGAWEGRRERWLRWADARRQAIPSGAERAEQERERAERLAARLRELGIDPEGEI